MDAISFAQLLERPLYRQGRGETFAHDVLAFIVKHEASAFGLLAGQESLGPVRRDQLHTNQPAIYPHRQHEAI